MDLEKPDALFPKDSHCETWPIRRGMVPSRRGCFGIRRVLCRQQLFDFFRMEMDELDGAKPMDEWGTNIHNYYFGVNRVKWF